MRLLFDENLSERLVDQLADLFPNSLHVRGLGRGGAPHRVFWALAIQHACLLVTGDEDFLHLSTRYGSPPKVVWVAGLNRPTEQVAALLRAQRAGIARLVADDEATFLILA